MWENVVVGDARTKITVKVKNSIFEICIGSFGFADIILTSVHCVEANLQSTAR